jgi:hypothetical protein
MISQVMDIINISPIKAKGKPTRKNPPISTISLSLRQHASKPGIYGNGAW